MDTEKYIDLAKELVFTYGLKVISAIAVLIVGLFIIGRLMKFFRKSLAKKEVETALANFLVPLVGVLLKAMLFISVASMAGIATTSFIAVLGAMGLAVGLALQGSLANFAGGVLILLFKPFGIDDIISAQGHTGRVKDISVLVTKLLTPQNRLVIIPNGPLANGNIVNLTAEKLIRVDMTLGIGYGENIQKARNVLLAVMQNHPKVLKDPAPAVGVTELGDSSVNLILLPFADPEDYWNVYFEVMEQAKIALDEAGIEIPFPQRVIHRAED